MSVSLLAILRGFRRPDGILVHYPVFSCDTRFYPSSILSIDEELLSQAFMGCVLACFTRNGGNPEESPILSPINAPLYLLNKLPPITMFVSEADCLRD